jgi:Tfp pilus assembly protein PilX
MNSEPQDIINTVGALAEMTATYYATLLNNGIDAATAVVFTSVYIRAMIPPQNCGGGKEE